MVKIAPTNAQLQWNAMLTNATGKCIYEPISAYLYHKRDQNSRHHICIVRDQRTRHVYIQCIRACIYFQLYSLHSPLIVHQPIMRFIKMEMKMKMKNNTKIKNLN